jgi:hypothetical protein
MSNALQYSRDPIWGPLSYPATETIEAGSQPWKDHIYIAFWDAVNEAYGFLHFNSSPNHDTAKAQATLLLKGKFYDLKEVPPAKADRMRSESFDFDMGSHLAVDGDRLKGVLRLDPRFIPVDYTGHKEILPPLVPGQPLNHWQQGVRLYGDLNLDGETHSIDALGFRTRTWGFRDDSMQFTEYFSLFACFDEFDISIMKFRQPDGTLRTDGAVSWRDGRSMRCDDIHITRDSAASPVRLVIDMADGSTIPLDRQQRAATMWCPIGLPRREGPTFCAFDEFIEWKTPQGDLGYGLNEQGIIRFVF